MAKEIELKDALENMGAQMVREVASKTSDVAGDGTTTATVRAQAIYREGAKNVTAGARPMALKRGIDKAVDAITAELEKMSKPVTGSMIDQVGTISANHDEPIGRIIAEAMEKVGEDGLITVEEARSIDTSLDVVEGMQFDRSGREQSGNGLKKSRKGEKRCLQSRVSETAPGVWPRLNTAAAEGPWRS